jgi:hypothetical protein
MSSDRRVASAKGAKGYRKKAATFRETVILSVIALHRLRLREVRTLALTALSKLPEGIYVSWVSA